MNTVKYYKEEINEGVSTFYLKVLNDSNVLSVRDSKYMPVISWNSYPLSNLNEHIEITEIEFNEACNRVINFLKGV
jgi:hypothetical protein